MAWDFYLSCVKNWSSSLQLTHFLYVDFICSDVVRMQHFYTYGLFSYVWHFTETENGLLYFHNIAIDSPICIQNKRLSSIPLTSAVHCVASKSGTAVLLKRQKREQAIIESATALIGIFAIWFITFLRKSPLNRTMLLNPWTYEKINLFPHV